MADRTWTNFRGSHGFKSVVPSGVSFSTGGALAENFLRGHQVLFCELDLEIFFILVTRHGFAERGEIAEKSGGGFGEAKNARLVQTADCLNAVSIARVSIEPARLF